MIISMTSNARAWTLAAIGAAAFLLWATPLHSHAITKYEWLMQFEKVESAPVLATTTEKRGSTIAQDARKKTEPSIRSQMKQIQELIEQIKLLRALIEKNNEHSN